LGAYPIIKSEAARPGDNFAIKRPDESHDGLRYFVDRGFPAFLASSRAIAVLRPAPLSGGGRARSDRLRLCVGPPPVGVDFASTLFLGLVFRLLKTLAPVQRTDDNLLV